MAAAGSSAKLYTPATTTESDASIPLDAQFTDNDIPDLPTTTTPPWAWSSIPEYMSSEWLFYDPSQAQTTTSPWETTIHTSSRAAAAAAPSHPQSMLPPTTISRPASQRALSHDPSPPRAGQSSRASPPSPSSSNDPDRKRKRDLNTEAARRYRQRKADRVTELEEALAQVSKERDELKVKLARAETEADVLRTLVGKRD